MGGRRKTSAECNEEWAEKSDCQCKDEQEEKTRRDSGADI